MMQYYQCLYNASPFFMARCNGMLSLDHALGIIERGMVLQHCACLEQIFSAGLFLFQNTLVLS